MQFLGTFCFLLAVGGAGVFGYLEWQQRLRVAEIERQKADREAETREREQTAGLVRERVQRASSCWQAVGSRLGPRGRLKQKVAVIIDGTQTSVEGAAVVHACSGLFGTDSTLVLGKRAEVSRAVRRLGTVAKKTRGAGATELWTLSPSGQARWFRDSPDRLVERLSTHVGSAYRIEPPPAQPPVMTELRSAPSQPYVALGIGCFLGFGLVGLLLRRRRSTVSSATDIDWDLQPPTTSAVMATTGASQRRSLSRAQRQMLEQLRADGRDVNFFLRETFRVIVRLNPVNQQVYEFNQTLEGIKEGMANEAISGVVNRAIAEVDLTAAVADLDAFDETLDKMVSEMLLETPRDLARAMPDYRSRMPNLPVFETWSESAKAQLRNALHSTRHDLEVIQHQFTQLREYVPRYTKIMTRSGFLDVVLGFAAGFFGGELGALGAELWEGWRNQGDKEFVESFASAVEQFSGTALAFTQATEGAIEPVVAQIAADLSDIQAQVVAELEHQALDGLDIAPLYDALRKIEAADPDDREFFEMIIANLKQDGLATRSEKNLRFLLGM